MIYDVIVVGAGASGMICAGYLGKAGLNTLLIEKRDNPGRKLRITGKGRCNITNNSSSKEHFANVEPKPKFLKGAYSKFFVEETIAFFNAHGVPIKEERGARVFPESDTAQDVVDSLHRFCIDNNVKIKLKTAIKNIIKQGNIFTLTDDSANKYNASQVVIATGGCSYPVTGSTGDGQRFAQALGHKVSDLKPGLVPLNTKGNLAQRMQGVSLKNVTASIWQDNKKLVEEFGEMMFTHFGVTGPIILSLSNKISHLPISDLELRIDLKPALDHAKLEERLLRDFDEHGRKQFESVLKLLLPSKMIGVCADELKIPLDTIVNQIKANQRKELRMWLKQLTFPLQSTRSFTEAIITIGGVTTDELNKNTLESKLVPNLYFCGEVIDLHANTGGFNLQIAFSTGYTVAEGIRKKLAISN
ncbi:MAG: NAD(P)/FAD-dependent oxidoreductase [Candidatus Cloacimonadales bacterium]